MSADLLKNLVPSLLADYEKAHGLRDVPILCDHLRPMFEERGWVDKIIWEEFFFDSQHIIAQVQFYKGEMGVYSGVGDYARIQFSQNLNFCWRRFAICKEMFHALIDKKPETRVVNVPQLLLLSELLVSSSAASLKSFSPYETEHWAEILALETLFPYELRSHFEERYRNGEITDHQLAIRFRIPEEYARMGMYPNYCQTIREIRGANLVALP